MLCIQLQYQSQGRQQIQRQSKANQTLSFYKPQGVFNQVKRRRIFQQQKILRKSRIFLVNYLGEIFVIESYCDFNIRPSSFFMCSCLRLWLLSESSGAWGMQYKKRSETPFLMMLMILLSFQSTFISFLYP